MRSIKLGWQNLVRFARSGRVEKRGPSGKPALMLWSDSRKTVFVSDQSLLDQINTARAHSNPFVLIGPQHTGKNVFLNLVARGAHKAASAPCVDENVVNDPEVEIERFFGKEGVVDRNRSALLHFDFMERAVTWDTFIEKLHKIAVEGVLDRTDGRVIRCPKIRVVLGANYDLPPTFPSNPQLVKYLYAALSGNQLARTRRLDEQFDRLPAILEEMLATIVIRGESDPQSARRVEQVPTVCLDRLRRYSVPNEFTGLFGIVRAAARTGSWERAIGDTQPGTVFVAWGGKSRAGGARLAEKLRESGMLVQKAPESLEVGQWWPQIKQKLSDVDFIVFTFCREDFRANTRLVKWKEWREAVEIEKTLARPLIFPVFLDKTQPDELKTTENIEPGLLEDLLSRHWYWVSWRSRQSGFEKLHDGLSKWLKCVRGT
jgi:hypothetical protein